MSKAEEKKFPITYKHENGATMIALDEVQAAAIEKQGFKEETPKKK